MKVQLLQVPLLNPIMCAECGFVMAAMLADDKKSVTYQHHGADWLKCSQVNTQFSMPVTMVPMEIEAEIIQEKST